MELALFLKASEGYQSFKGFFYDLLENREYKYKKYFDYFIIVLVLSSIFILIEELEDEQKYSFLVLYDTYIITTVFAIEYLLRIWVYSDFHQDILDEYEKKTFLGKEFRLRTIFKTTLRKKIAFMTSPLAVIDLLAIIPAYREFRIFRIFILFRVFKLLRYSDSVKHFANIITSKKIEFYTIFLFLIFSIFVAGVALYMFEIDINPNLNSIFDAFYWAMITITTVGYGDISPVTTEGRAITSVIILEGVTLISFTTSLVVASFYEQFLSFRYDNLIARIHRLESYYIICGYSTLSKAIAQKLKSDGKEVVIIDLDETQVAKASEDGLIALVSDATEEDTMRKLGVSRNKNLAILSLTEDDVTNTFIALNVRSLDTQVMIISRLVSNSAEDKLRLAGVNYTISPHAVSSLLVVEYISRPVVFDFMLALINEHHSTIMDEVQVVENSLLVSKNVKDVKFRLFNLIFIGIIRFGKDGSEFLFNPDGECVIRKDDFLILMGHRSSLDYFKSSILKQTFKVGTNEN